MVAESIAKMIRWLISSQLMTIKNRPTEFGDGTAVGLRGRSGSGRLRSHCRANQRHSVPRDGDAIGISHGVFLSRQLQVATVFDLSAQLTTRLNHAQNHPLKQAIQEGS